MIRTASVAGAILFLLALPATSLAQQPPAIAEAARLRDTHQFASAARALDPYLRNNPADAGTHWFQAQLLYWAGSHDAAKNAYERAIALTPADDALRIDYARFLVATGRITRAREILDGVAQPHTTDVRCRKPASSRARRSRHAATHC